MGCETAIAVVSLGCAKNLVDSEVMMGLLQQAGHRLVDEVQEADVILVNTCAFIQPAKEESVEALLEMAALKERGRCRALVCCGCFPQRHGDELVGALPEVDAFVGTSGIARIPEVVAAVLRGERPVVLDAPAYLYDDSTPRVHTGPPWLAYLKIAEGCDNTCSFCAIPAARGRFRSRTIESVAREFGQLVAAGAREVNLVAQDTTYYGVDLASRSLLPELLRRLGEADGDCWVRVLYLHPHRVGEELIQAIASTRNVVPYFDVPMQHATQRLLTAMGRSETPEANLALIRRIRAALPEAAVRTTLLVGFPGETENDFEALLEFVEAAQFDRLAGFVFSPEEGTPAYELPGRVAQEAAEERLAVLMATQAPISRNRNEALVGTQLEVLVERTTSSAAVGRTYRDAPEVDGEILLDDCSADPGSFVLAAVEAAETHDLRGRVIASAAVADTSPPLSPRPPPA